MLDLVGLVLHYAASSNRNGSQISARHFFNNIGNSKTLSRSSICESRQKINWEAFHYLLLKLNDQATVCGDVERWRGKHRVYAVDGTRLKLPHHQETLSSFKQPRNQFGSSSHFPQALSLCVQDVFSGVISGVQMESCERPERKAFQSLLNEFEEEDIFLMDRGFDGFNTGYEVTSRNMHFVCRERTGRPASKVVRSFLYSSVKDKVVEVEDAEGRLLKKRLLKCGTSREGRTIVISTSLIGKKYPRKEIWRLYKKRWEIETGFRYLKQLQKVQDYRSKKLNSVFQEIFAHLFVLSLCQLLKWRTERTLRKRKTLTGLQRLSLKFIYRQVEHNLAIFIYSGLVINEDVLLSQEDPVTQTYQPGRTKPRISKSPATTWTRGTKNKNIDRERRRTRSLSRSQKRA